MQRELRGRSRPPRARVEDEHAVGRLRPVATHPAVTYAFALRGNFPSSLTWDTFWRTGAIGAAYFVKLVLARSRASARSNA